MANRTDPVAHQIRGFNPQNLVSRIVRRKIYECNFWKEQCFAVTAETVIDPCVALTYVGGTYGGKRHPAPFLCIVLKLLQIQPEEEIILEFIKQEQFKYLRAVAAFYFRLTGRARDVYLQLEPLLADYRKLRLRLADGKYSLICMDEFVDDCLRKGNLLDVDLPALPKREVLEAEGELPPSRLSALEHDVEVYAGGAIAGGATTEREQQLWLLQKEKLQAQQKKLQRHVLQQRMKQRQQEQEQQLLQQVKELELENNPSAAEAGSAIQGQGPSEWGTWKEKHKKGGGKNSELHDFGGVSGERSHQHRRAGVGSRSPTPVIRRDRRGEDDPESRRRRRREEDEDDADRRRRRIKEENGEDRGYRGGGRRRKYEEDETDDRHRHKSRRGETDDGDDRRRRREKKDDRWGDGEDRRQRRRHRDDGGREGEREEKRLKKEDHETKPAYSYTAGDKDRKRGKDDSLSVQEWDALRAELGLKPLRK
ncbi:pre-mrna splicing factor [Cystoisospora suis]|uniref:Pre-mRNA-splicing factor 38 n=1 Tax=Cystoisospora suis TaxID=483139 RepID=A0A2C6KWV4_9APIC|nr:pre-mrna splicing factor [Cystoisospora suis]